MPQPLLSLASHLFSSVALARRRWYASHPAARRRLARPVISIGNLSVGGTGKTPVVVAIARLLIGMGERPAIISRGYKRQRSSEGVVVVSDGASVRADVAHAGDEPFMMARALPNVVVLVSSQRYLGGRLAETQFDCSVHLLDDGFQHLGLVRDLDLLIVTDDDLSKPRVLPLGRLREPLSAAAAADAILVSAGDALEPAQVAGTLGVLQSFGFDRVIERARAVRISGGAGDEVASAVYPGPVFAIAGIAKPQRFFDDVQHAGWSLAGTRAFADHHRFSPREIADIERAAQLAGAKAVLTTEKDMVRLEDAAAGASLIPMLWVPLRVTIEPSFTPWLRDGLARARAPRHTRDALSQSKGAVERGGPG